MKLTKLENKIILNKFKSIFKRKDDKYKIFIKSKDIDEKYIIKCLEKIGYDFKNDNDPELLYSYIKPSLSIYEGYRYNEIYIRTLGESKCIGKYKYRENLEDKIK